MRDGWSYGFDIHGDRHREQAELPRGIDLAIMIAVSQWARDCDVRHLDQRAVIPPSTSFSVTVRLLRRQQSGRGVAAKRARRKDVVDILRERLKPALQIVVNRCHQFVEPSTH